MEKNILFKFVLSSSDPWGPHGILSSHEDGEVHFSGPVGSLCFHMDDGQTTSYEGVTFRNYSRWTPPPFSCPIGKCRVQVLKVNLTNHREVCRIKFYQILTSNWQFDKLRF